MQAVGGKGGGKPGLAQGSVSAPQDGTVELALKEARSYLESVKLSV
jgi:alanyl-tRNA synthetase